MAIDLTLGMPRRDASSLIDGLFEPAAAEFVSPMTADVVRELVDNGVRPGIAMSEPERRIADFLAVQAHSSVGFVARAETPDEVLAILCATVAALCGEDIVAALRTPDIAVLDDLRPDAAAAVREVLVAVDVPDATAVAVALRGRGLR